MFGYKLIKKDEYEMLRKSYNVQMRVNQCWRWFSGWKDLDIIWDYLIKPEFTIDRTRDLYAEKRGTDCYGDIKCEELKLIKPHHHDSTLFIRCEHCLMFGTPIDEPFTEVICGNCNIKTSRWYVPFCCVENYSQRMPQYGIICK